MWEAQESHAWDSGCCTQLGRRSAQNLLESWASPLAASRWQGIARLFLSWSWQMYGLVHGNGFVFAGREKCLTPLAGKFEVKVVLTVREGPGVLRVLNRSLRWTKHGVIYESGNWNVDRLVE